MSRLLSICGDYELCHHDIVPQYPLRMSQRPDFELAAMDKSIRRLAKRGFSPQLWLRIVFPSGLTETDVLKMAEFDNFAGIQAQADPSFYRLANEIAD